MTDGPDLLVGAGTGVVLDRRTEPWVGSFAGLGEVRVGADGDVEVEVDPSVDEAARHLADAALRHGWGETLSVVRQGFEVLWGAVVVPPEGAPGAEQGVGLSVRGDAHDVGIVLLALEARGWGIVADRFTPVRWDGECLVAHPRPAPPLFARRRATKAGRDGVPVRVDTDAVAVDVRRGERPAVVAGSLEVLGRRPGRDPFEELTGHARFEAATHLFAAGVLATAGPTEPRDVMARHLKLAELGFARLHVESKTLDDDLASVDAWWGTVAS